MKSTVFVLIIKYFNQYVVMVLLIVVFFETRFLPRRVSYCDVSPMLLVFMNVDKYKLGRSRFYMPSSLDGDRGYSHQR